MDNIIICSLDRRTDFEPLIISWKMIIPCYSDSSPSFFYEKGYQVFIDNNLEQDPLVKWKSAYALENKTFIFWKSYTRYIRSPCLKSIFWSIYTVENGYSKDMLDIQGFYLGVFFFLIWLQFIRFIPLIETDF